MNLILSIVEVQNHEYKTSFFTSGNIIKLESYEDQYVTNRSVYKTIYMIRNLPFVFPLLTDYRNKLNVCF